jgi:hypothetical protein
MARQEIHLGVNGDVNGYVAHPLPAYELTTAAIFKLEKIIAWLKH